MKKMDVDKRRLDKFKQNLSPFAQKVLDKLLTFKKENASTIINGDTYKTRPQPDNRKVIVFKDFSNNLSASQLTNKKANHFADATSSEIAEYTSRISTSEELLSRVTVDRNCRDSSPTVYTQEYNVLEAPKLSPETFHYNSLKKKLSVNWNDFLDENFFDNLDSIPKYVPNEKDKNEDKHEDIFNMTFNTGNSYQNFKAKDVKINDVSEAVVPPKGKKSSKSNKIQTIEKRKHEKTQSLRKEKYKKAVKNWLNDAGNNVDKTVTQSVVNDVRNDVNDETNNKIDKDINKKVKKIVQAQLANKGGIMKFTKPKPDKTKDNQGNSKLPTSTDDFKPQATEETCDKVKEKPSPKERKTSEETKSADNVKVKEKKPRSKFVAPVLTPLPVIDVTFEIHALDQELQGEALFKSENTEIVMILLYSSLKNTNISKCVTLKTEEFCSVLLDPECTLSPNLIFCTGYSQLNCQYASAAGAGAPEGVMFGVRDQYYYINDFTIVSEEVICRAISNNTLICFNAKEVLIFLMDHYDLSSCSYNIIDLKIGASLLNPDESPDSFSKLRKLLGKTSQFSIASDCPLQKCARYMGLLRECDDSLRGMLADAGMWKLFSDIEMQSLPVIAEMEHPGICINEDHLKQLDIVLLTHIKEAELKCYEAAGRSFQINSALQVRNIVYGELKLDERCNVAVRETVRKAKSTSEAMLRLLTPVHPLPALVLQYRHLHKARATFVAGILHHARRSVVRPTWEQNAAVTGRVACSNPNLQAIPKTFCLSLYTEQTSDGDSAGADAGTLSFRGAYVARAGRVLLAADFRHAECRVLALAAADATLTAALASPDLFAVLAAQWLGKSEAHVSAGERERTKRLVYACVYGAGARRLADILRVSDGRARALMDSFHESFPALRRFGADVVRAARGGRLSTAGGRARRLPQLSSADRAARAHAERQAVNFIVQGSAADLCKSAMVCCGAALRSAGLAARLLLQIHDELVWELPPQQLPAAAQVIKTAMEGCGARVGLPAVFPVQLSAGPSWGDLAPYSV